MSFLKSSSKRHESNQNLLRELSLAFLSLETETVGETTDLDISKEDISSNQKILHDFAIRLEASLSSNRSIALDIQLLVDRIKSHRKPLKDWKQDLLDLARILQNNQQLDGRALETLKDVFAILDDEFVKDHKRLYFK